MKLLLHKGCIRMENISSSKLINDRYHYTSSSAVHYRQKTASLFHSTIENVNKILCKNFLDRKNNI